MKNVVIILGLAALFGVIGFGATMVIVQQHQNAANIAPAPTGDPARDLANSTRFMGQAAGDMTARQNDAMIGGGAGIALGVLLGVGLVAYLGKKKNT